MKRCCLASVGLLSISLLVASIALLVARVLQKAVDSQVKQESILRNGTEAFKVWEDPSPPIYMQFYFFNLTNPLEVLTGATPMVDEIGPYTYREHRPKVDVHILDNGTRVSALNPKSYVFVREQSVGDAEVDLIRTVNIPAVMAMERSKSISLPIEVLLIVLHEELFTTRTVHELLWGYTDRLLALYHKIHPEVDSQFGLFYKMNGTADGEYVVLTGKRDYLNISRIVTWKGKKALNWWTSDMCNMINGTDGSTFHPLISRNEIIYVFSSDFCRSLYLMFDSFVSVAGIPAYRFVPPARIFANVSFNPENAGFCTPAGNCPGSGLLNVSVCREGAPIFLSSPHFYQADQKYVDDILGMHPNKEDHETFLDINPMTGLLVRAGKRMQVNVYIEKIPKFFQTGNIRTLVFPVMYVNESVLIDEASAKKLKFILLEAAVFTNIPYMIMVLGIIFGVVFVVLAYRFRRATEEDREALVEPE